jgi:hypothetical protein
VGPSTRMSGTRKNRRKTGVNVTLGIPQLRSAALALILVADINMLSLVSNVNRGVEAW